MVEIKFCGMTRGADAAAAAKAGADYIGVVFAGGPRRQDHASAAGIFGAVAASVRRVGVFGTGDPGDIAALARALSLDVVQLHGDPSAADVTALRAVWPGGVWAALRVAGTELPAWSSELFAAADAVVLDAKVEGALGGTGVAVAWDGVASTVERMRAAGGARLVLAGGLRPENVAQGIRALAPDAVDVSSGIESTVGIKDPARMRAFRDAVRSLEGVR